MTNLVIAGISNILDAEFGCDIHMDEIKQGLEEPCFFIDPINSSVHPYPGGRCLKKNPFVILYFPEGGNEECYETAERLMRYLEVVYAGGVPVRGTGMNYRVEDGILHFFVDYNFFTRNQKQTTPMEEFISHTDAKGR